MKSGIRLIWVIALITILSILPTINIVSAADQTQQFNKVFLSPFYRDALTQNINYTYSLDVNPPDGISTVKSAIITIDSYINPTRTFSVYINNQSCANPTYTVSTTYASAGKSTVYFDCSNRINKAGTYEVKVSVAGGNVGSTTAWLDLTYMNKPGKKLGIFGTEYTVGDSGKIFIQLLENDMTAINNASCYISIYNPGGTLWYTESLMTYQSGSNGLYYFDFTAPATYGVYMTDIFCEYYVYTQRNNATSYAIAKGWYVSGNGTSLTTIDSNYLTTAEYNFNTGAVSNVTTVLMAHLDEYVTAGTTLDSSASPTTGTHVSGVVTGIPGQVGSAGVSYGASPGDYTQFSAAAKLNLASTDNFMLCLSFNESVTNANGNRLISGEVTDTIRFSFDGGNAIRFQTDRSATGGQTVQSPATYLDSQWHTVCGYQNASLMYLYIDGSLVATTTAAQSGTLTLGNGLYFGARDGGGNDAAVSMDEVCYIKGTEAQFASPTPGALATAYNTYKQCGVPQYNLDQNVTISGITVLPEYNSYDIITTYRWNDAGETVPVYLWNYTGSTWYQLPNSLSTSLTDATVSSNLVTNISQFLSGGTMIIRYNDSAATHYTAGTLRLNQVRLEQTAFVEVPINQIRGGGEIHVSNIPRMTTDLVNAETPGYVWNHLPNRNLTYYEDVTNYTKINEEVPQYVWNYTDRNLTYYEDVTNYTLVGESVWTSSIAIPTGLLDQIANAVWTRPDRNLTYYELTAVNYTLIGDTVWGYTGVINVNLLTQVATAIWTSPDRNLTYYEQVDLTNYTQVAESVWNNAIRNLTYYQDFGDQVNYTKINTEVPIYVWNYADRNLTYYEHVDMTNYSQAAQYVWEYVNRSLTSEYINNISAQEIWEYVNRSLTYYEHVDMTNYTQMVENVWAYVNRTLTYYQDFGDQTNYTLINEGVANSVWTATDRNLTYYQNFGDQTNYSQIILGVWSATDRNLTYYPAQVDLTNYTLITNNVVGGVWNATDRNLTYYPQQIDLTNYSQIADVVWNAANRNLTYTEDVTDYNQIIVGVWNYTTRNLTFYPVQVDLTNYTKITEDVAAGVWLYSDRNLTYYEHVDMTNYSKIAEDVWNYATRNLTFTEDVTDYNMIILGVWNATDRNLTYYPAQVDLTNYTAITDNVVNGVWNATDRNLTYYPAQMDLTNYSQISEVVWNYVSRNLTYTEDVTDYNQIIVGVWNFTTRNLTFYPVQMDLTNYTKITEDTAAAVWVQPDRNLTYYEHVDMTNYTQAAETIWNYATRNLTFTEDVTDYNLIILGVWNATDRNLTYYPAQVDLTNYTAITENVVNGVWNATDRNLTYYPTQMDLTNYSQISDVVWNAANRNLTYTEDVTDYNQIIVGVWNYTTRNLTFYPAQVDLTNYTLISDTVWTAPNRNLTYYADVTNYTLIGDTVWGYTNTVNGNLLTQVATAIWSAPDRNLTYYEHVDMTNYTLIQEMVWQNLNRTLTDFDFTVSVNETAIADAVWTSVDRTLTSFNFTVDAIVNNTELADSVWSAVNRTLTDYNQSDLTDYNKIQTMVWNATDRNLTYYENFGDQTNYTLIQTMVWENLNRTLTNFDFTVDVNETLISDAVWTAVDRTLTSFNFTVEATVNNTQLAEAVWSAVNRTLTDYNQSDLTDYNKIQTMVWNATDRNLTYYENFGDQTNYTLISDTIWTAVDRTLTDINFTVEVNTTEIANAVWESSNRTLTFFPEWADTTNYTLIQEVVWQNAVRTLTDFNFTVETNNTNIAEAVWQYTNKTVQFANGSVDTVGDIRDMGHTYVGGTEYVAGDNGKITIRLVRGTGALAEVETGADCSVNVLYPNMTDFVTNGTMTEISDGAYYYNFAVPTQLGIYTYFTNCNVSDRFYFSLDDFHVYAPDYSSIPGAVWSNPDRNLTYTEPTLTANDIWTNPTRDLTYYPTANLTLSNESIQELGNAVWQYSGTINSNILTQFANTISCTIENLQSDLNLQAGVHLNSC